MESRRVTTDQHDPGITLVSTCPRACTSTQPDNGMTAEHAYADPGRPGRTTNGHGSRSRSRAARQGQGSSEAARQTRTTSRATTGGDGGVDDSPNSQNSGGSQSQQNHEEAGWKGRRGLRQRTGGLDRSPPGRHRAHDGGTVRTGAAVAQHPASLHDREVQRRLLVSIIAVALSRRASTRRVV